MPDSAQQILDVLSRSKNVLVTTHVRPDGDALGSTAGMVLAMRARGIKAHVVLLSKLPGKYAFLYTEAQIPYSAVDPDWPVDVRLGDFDTLLVVDTGTWSQLPGLKERLTDFSGKKLVVDHHLTQEDWADYKHVVTTAAAAGEIVGDLVRAWDVPLNKSIATVLYVAVVSDTGWLQHSNTTPKTMRFAADLMEAGADPDALHQLLYQSERAQRVTLQAHALTKLRLLCDDRLAVLTVSPDDFDKALAVPNDTENLINLPLQIKTVEVSTLLTKSDAGPVRVSVRSKGKLDVARFAEQFGGGGHARAAGLRIDASLDDATAQLVQALTRALS